MLHVRYVQTWVAWVRVLNIYKCLVSCHGGKDYLGHKIIDMDQNFDVSQNILHGLKYILRGLKLTWINFLTRANLWWQKL